MSEPRAMALYGHVLTRSLTHPRMNKHSTGTLRATNGVTFKNEQRLQAPVGGAGYGMATGNNREGHQESGRYVQWIAICCTNVHQQKNTW